MASDICQPSVTFVDEDMEGVVGLLSDLEKLLNDRETADVIFLIGREEVPFYTHRLIIWARYM